MGSKACQKRGGRLFNVESAEELVALREFVGNQEIGLGIRDYGGYVKWRFDGPEEEKRSAAQTINEFEQNCGTCFEKLGCVKSQRRGTMVGTMDCDAKSDWVCEGRQENNLNEAFTVKNDLMA